MLLSSASIEAIRIQVNDLATNDATLYKMVPSCNEAKKLTGDDLDRKEKMKLLERNGDVLPNGRHALPDECPQLVYNKSKLNHEIDVRLMFGTPKQLFGPILEFGGNVGGDLQHFINENPCSQVFSYEPLPFLYKKLLEHPNVVSGKDRVHIVNAGVGAKTENVTFFGGGGDGEEAASMYHGGSVTKPKETWSALIVDITHALESVRKESGEYPEAMSFNCEGCEYPSLDRYLRSPLAGKVKHLQVSWHLVDIPDRAQKHCQIKDLLKEAGYVQTYFSYFGWEGFSRTSN